MRTIAEICASFEELPVVNINYLLGGRRALVLAPHPDDESLGCGGLIAAACAIGLPPIVIILTDGAGSHPGSCSYPPERLRILRETETRRAAGILGLSSENLVFLRYPDTALPRAGVDFGQAVGRVLQTAQQHRCSLIFAPWHADPHCDHEAAARIGDMAAKIGGWQLLSYPVWGWLRDADDTFEEPRTNGQRLDIHTELARKKMAIAAHVSQYGGLIKDSPNGFQLPPDLMAIFSKPFEVFIS